jgi:hypothetical protein
MLSTPKPDLSNWVGYVREDRDHSLYGSLWIVAACLAVLATLIISG